jgi:hypothetical protein
MEKLFRKRESTNVRKMSIEQVKQKMGQSVETTSVEDFLENVAYQKLKRLLHETVGFDCGGYRDEYLKRRFAVRLSATGTNTYRRYVRYLKKNPAEYNFVLNNLVINYTTFFRDRDVYVYLEKTVLPRLFRSNEVRIWSAGCATGEDLTHWLFWFTNCSVRRCQIIRSLFSPQTLTRTL